MNPFAVLIRSRKFWLAVLDFLAGILALWVTALVPEPMRNLILATWAAFQPVLIVVILSITIEDKANIAASAKIEEAALYHKTTIAEIAADKAKDAPGVTSPPGGCSVTGETAAGVKMPDLPY